MQLTNLDVRTYTSSKCRGEWMNHFTLQELIELNGVAHPEIIKLLAQYVPGHVTRKEIHALLGGDVVVWLGGYSALTEGAVMASPVIPTASEVHVLLYPTMITQLELYQERYGDQEWSGNLIPHFTDATDIDALSEAIPAGLSSAHVVSGDVSPEYLELLVSRLNVGGYLWLDDSFKGGLPLADPTHNLSVLNNWLADNPDLTVHVSSDMMGYTLVRKNK